VIAKRTWWRRPNTINLRFQPQTLKKVLQAPLDDFFQIMYDTTLCNRYEYIICNCHFIQSQKTAFCTVIAPHMDNPLFYPLSFFFASQKELDWIPARFSSRTLN